MSGKSQLMVEKKRPAEEGRVQSLTAREREEEIRGNHSCSEVG